MNLPESKFLKAFAEQEYGFLNVVGTAKEYKTGTICQLLHYVPELMVSPKTFVGIDDVSFLPKYLNAEAVSSIFDIRPRRIAILDDLSYRFPSRDKNIGIQKIISILSHKHVKGITASQTKANRDLAFERDVKVTDLHKYMDLHSIAHERPDAVLQCLIANLKITAVSEAWGIWRGFLSYIPEYEEVLYLPEPAPWYDDRLSHSLYNVDIKGVRA